MRIAIIGSGTVGRATGLGLERWGHSVSFHDTDPRVLEVLAEQGHRASESLHRADIYMVCVPTPDVHLAAVKEATRMVSEVISTGATYALRSTAPPGTTRQVVLPILRAAGDGINVCYHPEYLRSQNGHNPLRDFLSPRAVVIGEATPDSGRSLRSLYEPHVQAPVLSVPLEVAEWAKLVHNHFNAAKISFFNEAFSLAESLGIDGNEANRLVALTAEAAWNPAYGIVGGAPYAGACLPKDLSLTLELCETRGSEAPLLHAIRQVNRRLGGA